MRPSARRWNGSLSWDASIGHQIVVNGRWDGMSNIPFVFYNPLQELRSMMNKQDEEIGSDVRHMRMIQ